MDERIGIDAIETSPLVTDEMRKKYNRANKWFDKHDKPDQKLCPQIVHSYDTAKGTEYWSNVTGKRSCNKNEVINNDIPWSVVKPKKYGYEGFYVRYIKQLDALEFAFIKIKGNRGKDGEKRKWIYSEGYNAFRAIQYKNDSNLYIHAAPYYENEAIVIGRKYWNKRLVDYMGYRLSNEFNLKAAKEEFLKMCPNAIFDCDVCSLYRLEHFRKTYKTYFINHNIGNLKNDFDFLDIELPVRDFKPESHEVERTGWNNHTYTHTVSTGMAYLDQVNDDMWCLRIGSSRSTYSGYGRSYCINDEATRIYIPKEGKLFITQAWNNKWHRVNVSATNLYLSGGWSSCESYILNNPENLDKCNRTKYVKDLVDWSTSVGIKDFITMVRHPIIEQLCKMGYTELASAISSRGEINANLKWAFGVKTERKVAPLKLLGVNKRILDRFGDMKGRDILRAISWIKQVYGLDLSSLSDETLNEIDMLFDKNFMTSNYNNPFKYAVTTRRYGYYRKDSNLLETFDDDTRKKALHLIRVYNKTKDRDVIQLRTDCQRYEEIAIENGIDLEDYKNKEELIQMHNSLIDINAIIVAEREARYNMEKAEKLKKQKENFEKLVEKRVEKFEEIGKDFAVVVPKDMNDLIREGARLHHCVGSYVEQNAFGDTNIVFLRKVDEIDEPFYTIEINNANSVVQVHGNHNKWLGNDPEAIPFLYNYFKTRGFSFNNRVLLNLGMGYGASNESLPESYLMADVA